MTSSSSCTFARTIARTSSENQDSSAFNASNKAARICQAEGCFVNLREEGTTYSIKRNCCTEHIRADAIQKKGQEGYWRFCFQCGKLEPLSEFDGTKRSCRARLQKRKVLAPKRRSTWAASKFRTSSSTASPVSHTAAPAAGELEAEETPIALTLQGQQQQQPLHHSDLQMLPNVYTNCTDSGSIAASRVAGPDGCPGPQRTVALPYAAMATPATPVAMTSNVQPTQFSAALPVQQMFRTAADKCQLQAQAGAGVGQRRRAVLPKSASAHQLGVYSRGQQHVPYIDTCPGSADLPDLEADFTRLPDVSTASAVLWTPPQLASTVVQEVGGAAHAALGPQDMPSGCSGEEYDAMFDDLALFFERELEAAAAQARLSYGMFVEESPTSLPSGSNISCPGVSILAHQLPPALHLPLAPQQLQLQQADHPAVSCAAHSLDALHIHQAMQRSHPLVAQDRFVMAVVPGVQSTAPAALTIPAANQPLQDVVFHQLQKLQRKASQLQQQLLQLQQQHPHAMPTLPASSWDLHQQIPTAAAAAAAAVSTSSSGDVAAAGARCDTAAASSVTQLSQLHAQCQEVHELLGQANTLLSVCELYAA